MAVNVGSAVGYLDLDISKFKSALSEAQKEAKESAKTLENTLGNGLKGVGDTLSSAGSVLTKGITTPLIGAGTAAVKTTADFDSSMSKVSAVSGAVGKDFEALRSKAREMGATTKFSASDAADAMNYMAMAGWKTEDMLDGISGIMNLAAASGEDLATTSDIVTDALTAFGKSAEDSGRLADIMAAASSNANTNVAMMGESFKYVAPVAGALGYSMEDTSVAIGLMANAGIKAGQGGTTLRTILTNLAKPTDEMAMAMDALGVSLSDDEGNMKSLRQVMLDLRSGFGELMISEEEFNEEQRLLQQALDDGAISQKEYDEQLNALIERAYGAEGAEKARYAAMLAGKTGMSGLLAIVNASQEDFDKLTESIDNSTGAAENMAKIMQDNLSGQITILLSALQELAISVGDILMPKLREFVTKVQDIVDKFNKLTNEQKENLIRWIALAAAIGPVLFIVGKVASGIVSLISTFNKLKTSISLIKSGMTLLGTSIGGITAPVVAVVAIIGVLIAAFVTLWRNNEEFRNNVIKIWKGIQESISGFVRGIKQRFDTLKTNMNDLVEGLKIIWNGFCKLLAPVFEGAFKGISNILNAVFGVITGLVDVFIGIFTGNWQQAWTGIKEIFTSIWNSLGEGVQIALDTIKAVFETAFTLFGTTWQEAWESIKQFFSDAWNNIVETMKSIAIMLGEAAKNAVDLVVKFFSNLPYNIGYIVGLVLGYIIKFVLDMINKARELGTQFLQTVISFFQQLPGNVHKFATDTYNNVVTWASNMREKAHEAGSNFISNVISFIQQLPGKVQSFLTQIISKLVTWVSNMGTKGKDGAKKLWDGVVNGLAGLPSKMISIGSDIVDGVWQGIKNAGSWFYGQVNSFFSGIVDGVKGALGIGSPSKVMRDEVGKWLPPGAAVGVEQSMPKTTKEILGEFNSMVNQVSKGLNPIVVGSKVTDIDVPNNLTVDQFRTGATGQLIDYYALATMLYQILKEAPIVINPEIYMEDGDVYFDTERVGRKVAPVVSRVVAMGGG